MRKPATRREFLRTAATALAAARPTASQAMGSTGTNDDKEFGSPKQDANFQWRFEGPRRSNAEIPAVAPGHPKRFKGIDMYCASNVGVEGCSFDHLPSSAIYCCGCVGAEIEDAWSRNCKHLVNADGMGLRCKQHTRLNRLHHADGRDGLFVAGEKPADPLPPFPKQKIVRLGNYQQPGSMPVSISDDFSRVHSLRP